MKGERERARERERETERQRDREKQRKRRVPRRKKNASSIAVTACNADHHVREPLYQLSQRMVAFMVSSVKQDDVDDDDETKMR